MFSGKKKTLSTKKFILYAAILAISASLLGMIYVFIIQTHTKATAYGHLMEIATLYADDIDSKITGNMQTLVAISTLMSTYDTADTEKFTYALALENPKNSFDAMAYITATGIIHGLGVSGTDVSGQLFFKRAMAGHSNYSFSDAAILGGNSTIIYATPLNHSGTTVGVLIGTRGLSSYQELVEKPIFSGDGFVNIIDRRGNILISSKNVNNNKDITNILDEVQFKSEKQKQELLHNFDLFNSDIIEYSVKGTERMVAYAPVHVKGSTSPILGVDDLYITAIVSSSTANARGDLIVLATFILVCGIVFSLVFWFVKSTRKQLLYQREIENLAFYDTLTGTYTVVKFKAEAEKILEHADGWQFAMVKFDINNFKLINDIYGFAVGDEVLKNIASSIKINLIGRVGSVFARISNDDFVVLSSFDDDEELIASADHFIALADAACMVTIPNYKIDFSIGICKWTEQDTPTIMLEKATMAQKIVKRSKGSGLLFYDDEMRDDAIRNKEIENTMRGALAGGEFVVYIQPKYSLCSGAVEGAEALVRWNHPNNGIIPPMEFIPLFERNGFIIQIDLFVFEEVVKLQRRNMDLGRRIVPISVNQSSVLLNLPDYAARVDRIVKKYNVPHKYIELELTETLFHNSMVYLNTLVNRLKQLGFGISIDDFGSGYSSLNMLKDIKADVIKLDRGFLRAHEDSERGAIVLTNIVRLAHELDIMVVAEGVETEFQADLLRKAECCLAQGFLYAKPMPMETFEKTFE